MYIPISSSSDRRSKHIPIENDDLINAVLVSEY